MSQWDLDRLGEPALLVRVLGSARRRSSLISDCPEDRWYNEVVAEARYIFSEVLLEQEKAA